ncbi:MAG: M67 family metallopeptidase [Chloroflexota bacterium]|nr:M67 family metallopeptidase [Chloroflexota bacterium]
MAQLPRRLYDEIVAHALEGYPNEVCGLIAALEGKPVQTYRVRNTAEEPRTRYVMDPQEQFDAMMDIEGRGWELYGIYHSHPSTQAYPSQTDRSLAFYPDAVYFICTLEHPDSPQVRAFHIGEEEVIEQELEVVEDAREETEVRP